mmetsp:Transcript_23725/g.45181  ORF Transcript_23725/g.45181 Transcript_23725/m.45181 type:complete len:228 (-) Transcript_23725:650-1333(-)
MNWSRVSEKRKLRISRVARLPTLCARRCRPVQVCLSASPPARTRSQRQPLQPSRRQRKGRKKEKRPSRLLPRPSPGPNECAASILWTACLLVRRATRLPVPVTAGATCSAARWAGRRAFIPAPRSWRRPPRLEPRCATPGPPPPPPLPLPQLPQRRGPVPHADRLLPRYTRCPGSLRRRTRGRIRRQTRRGGAGRRAMERQRRRQRQRHRRRHVSGGSASGTPAWRC